MKKTLIALALTAVAATASAKIDLYNQDGTTFSTYGRFKVVAEKNTEKEKGQKTTGHSDLTNDTRLGFDVKQVIQDDFYGVGRVEIRFNRNGDNAYAKRAYVGLGQKDVVQVTFGRQLLIGDDIGRIGLDNWYGVGSDLDAIGGWGILNASADKGVRVDYTAVPGLKLSADYSFAEKRSGGEVVNDTVKNGYSAGAIYQFDAAQGVASVSLGYSHNNYATGANYKKDRDGVYGGFNYTVNGVQFGVDGGFGTTKAGDSKDKLSFVRTGLRYDVPETNVGIYGNYGYLVVKSDDDKATAHRFMLGTDYAFHKNVSVFLEGKLDKIKFADDSKRTDKGVAVGLGVFW